jgi:hypothetical protein
MIPMYVVREAFEKRAEEALQLITKVSNNDSLVVQWMQQWAEWAIDPSFGKPLLKPPTEIDGSKGRVAMNFKATAKAKLTLEVEVDLSSKWSEDCTVAQVEKQAHDEARRIASRLVNRINGVATETDKCSSPISLRLAGIEDKIIVEIGNEKS